jgi:hypothetical protein
MLHRNETKCASQGFFCHEAHNAWIEVSHSNLKEITMTNKFTLALVGALLVASASAASAQTAQRYNNYDDTAAYTSSQGDASQANKIVGGENGGA